ncbi:IMP-specific 5-nucleotidase [Gonapodya prolifera JEL478]|uniref:IMP-specific 5'-nucleotidase 1 n=1 Tax=Gonapodya prolifera (strain JEL478) TaxID=1344416 RepID=A0A139AKC7_GONPJ|nr:IMP-specific 5-nucleotidase [Gonapodya prolifera JEL478]|eukprot:KXS17242.1 IMP-specific 5-nucleotidase [Gonapodya prolifera JEL478]
MVQLIDEHRTYTERGSPQLSRLSQLVPSVGTFSTPLPLRAAFLYQNELRSISSRQHVTPSFNDIRHILNTAQTRAAASTLRLITFDGAMTLYDDGGEFPRDSRIGRLLSAFLKRGVNLAIVTAARGWRGSWRGLTRMESVMEKAGRGESSFLAQCSLQMTLCQGGECNYLHTFTPSSGRLSYIPPSQYLPADISNPLSFSLHPSNTSRIAAFLDVVEQCLLETREEMNLQERTKVIRKERAVGVLPVEGMHSDTSNDAASVLSLPDLPFCAFNGGNDVWVDIGNKLIAAKILWSWLGIDGEETIHVGDQFLSTGNNVSTRSACCTLWVADPKETEGALGDLRGSVHYGFETYLLRRFAFCVSSCNSQSH